MIKEIIFLCLKYSNIAMLSKIGFLKHSHFSFQSENDARSS